MKPILFVFNSTTSARLQLRLAASCAKEGRSVVFLYEGGRDACFAEVAEGCRGFGGEVHSFADEIVEGETSPPLLRHGPHPWRSRAMALAADVTLALGKHEDARKRLAIFRGIHQAALAAANRCLARIDPAVLVVSEDGISSTMPVLAAARHRGAAIVDVPYGYGVAADLDISLEAKAEAGDLRMCEGPLAPVVRRLAPQWIKTGRFAGALMFMPEDIAAREGLGISLRNPWIVHGGYADRLCAESRQMLALYTSEGTPEARIALTGSPYCDVMVAGLDKDPQAKARLRQPQPIEPGLFRVLVCWPPSYHAMRGDKCEFATYREMTEAVVGWLRQLPGCRITVSLHPATLPEDRAALAALGVALSSEDVIELIPRHDIYVSYYSSTIRWAVAAGKPVVNYDLYRLGMDVYARAEGVVTVQDLAAYRAEITALTEPGGRFAAVAERQIRVAPDWGILDGGCSARILAELDKFARG